MTGGTEIGVTRGNVGKHSGEEVVEEEDDRRVKTKREGGEMM